MHSDLWRGLGITAETIPAPRRALPQQTATAPHTGPLTTKVVWDRLTDKSSTCLDDNLSRRGRRTSEEAKGLGERRCLAGTVPIPPDPGAEATELRCGVWHPEPLSFQKARERCRADGGFVASPTHLGAEEALLRYLREFTRSDIFWGGVFLVNPATRPVIAVLDNQKSPKYWNTHWNVESGAVHGLPCCPHIDSVTGDARCVVFDGFRALQKAFGEALNPYAVTPCDEQRPYFCEVPASTFDLYTQEVITFTTSSPHTFFSALPPLIVTQYVRQKLNPAGNGPRQVACKPSYVMTPSKKRLFEGELDKVLRHVSMTLAPLLPGESIVGSGSVLGGVFRCSHDFFTWNLEAHMQKTAEGHHVLKGVDLLVLPTFMEDASTVYSFPCGYASDGRPNVVVLNVAPSHLDAVASARLGKKKLRAAILQSLLHSLGFHEVLFHSWNQPVVNRTVASASCSVAGNHACRDMAVVVTPHVQAFLTTEQFRCTGHPQGGSGTLQGAELEDANQLVGPPTSVIGYWEKRLFRGEIMTILPPITEDQTSDEVPQLSGLTLAAFKDMGWYKVNDLMADRLRWGWRQRCEFASADCTAWPDRYRCSGSTAYKTSACSPDFTHLGYCNAAKWPLGEVPLKFRWLGAPAQQDGGQDMLMDLCFFKERVPGAAGTCLERADSDPDCEGEVCHTYQNRGAASRCFETTLRYKEFEVRASATSAPAAAPLRRGTCIEQKCKKIGGQWVVEVFVGGVRYECTHKGLTVGPSATSVNGVRTAANHTILGDIACPDPNEMCEEASESVLPTACEAMDDCNSHGSCQPDGTCACFNATVLPGPNPAAPHQGSFGFFAGNTCDQCAEGYFPYPSCTQRACRLHPETKLMCAGNGECRGDVGLCSCFNSSAKGYWDPATDCTTCNASYTGSRCTVRKCTYDGECGRGQCSATTGLCLCFSDSVQGRWAGLRCNRCKDGYDITAMCRVRVRNYFACDASARLDVLAAPPADISCAKCDTHCEMHGGAALRCRTPARVPNHDAYGCRLAQRVPKCTINPQVTAGRCGDCRPADLYLMDCKGFPSLYLSCWEPDDCGCLAASTVQCRVGTDAAPPPRHRPQVMNADGMPDPRLHPSHGASEKCTCHGVQPWEMECGRPLRGGMVYFEPRSFQVVEQDFCHCTSPSVPVCSDLSKPYFFRIKAFEKAQDCVQFLKESDCPDWSLILNIGKRANASLPDLSIVDCGGWPPLRLSASKDPCGCPFPSFTCMTGTEGVCGDSACPVWDEAAIELDCNGMQPPVRTTVARHPCGCDPPPKPTCREGTGPCCQCEYPTPRTIWVDCKGHGLDLPPWNDEAEYPSGNPYIQPCDPCPECVPPPPVRQCVPGTSAPRKAPANRLSPCYLSPLDLNTCPVYAPPCPVDCHGAPPPQRPSTNECECPPPLPPPCLPGTAGPGSVPDPAVHPMPCEADPTVCGAYACIPTADLSALASGRSYGTEQLRSCGVREELWTALSQQTRHCAQACRTDLDCACGYKCSVCGLCRHSSAQDPPVRSNCLLDHGASCAPYACALTCGADLDHIVSEGILFATCRVACVTNDECAPGAVCSLPLPASPTRRRGGGAAADPSTVRPQDAYGATAGIPGFDTTADPPFGEEAFGRTLDTDAGECVAAAAAAGDDAALDILRCYSHDDCGGYACGRDNRQDLFTTSVCRSSCWVNAHCHTDYRCARGPAVCVQADTTLPATRPQMRCEDDPERLLRNYEGCAGLLGAVLFESVQVTCASDLSRLFGFAGRVTMRTLCPATCGLCALQPRSSAAVQAAAAEPRRRVGQAQQQQETCFDDPDRTLAAFGATDTLRCAAVIEALGCDGDVGSLVDGIPAGRLVNELCPRTCRVCVPLTTMAPGGFGDGNTSFPGTGRLPDSCTDNHLTTPGRTLEERCFNQDGGCCFDASDSSCFTCNKFAPNPQQKPVAAGVAVLSDAASCDRQPFHHCHPYVCGGFRSAVPQEGAECPDFCLSNEACQPFYHCVFPTLAELHAQHAGGGAGSDYTFYESALLGYARGIGEKGDRGRCVRDDDLSDREQGAASLRRQKQHGNVFARKRGGGGGGAHSEFRLRLEESVPLLRVPVAQARGLQTDPNLVVFRHAPFVPAPPAQYDAHAVGKALVGSAAACFPYVAVQRGLSQEQLDASRSSNDTDMPGCRHHCASNTECQAGHFCTAVVKQVVSSAGGNWMVVDDPTCAPGARREDCLGDQRARAPADVDTTEEARTKGKCQPRRGLGSACVSGEQCGSGHCSRHICCNSACDTPCRTCVALGVCGWVAPGTDPHRGCASCERCDYLPDSYGNVSPASALGCVPSPAGSDAKNACGLRGTCNGEGGCVVSEGGWASADTCAVGFYGPDCQHSTTHYAETMREVAAGEVGEGGRTCSPGELAYRSGSPFTGDFRRAADTRFYARSEHGFERATVRELKTRLTTAVDLRPRQFASRVLGVSHHGLGRCSNILYEPTTPRSARVHACAASSYSPRQHFREPGGAEVEPALRYSPYVICRHTAADKCAAQPGCVWVVRHFEGTCVPDGSIRSFEEAEAACLKSYGCSVRNVSVACVGFAGRCRVVVDDKIDAATVNKPTLEWIELEFAEPVFVETVVLYENHAPGSLVKVELQPELTGSAALSNSGGGLRETDAGGASVPRRVKSHTAAAEAAAVDRCDTYTKEGLAFCRTQIGCLWDYNQFKCVQGTLCSVAKDECQLLEMRGLCFYNVLENRCVSGSPCAAASDGKVREELLQPYCTGLPTEADCTSGRNTPYCGWVPRVDFRCRAWDAENECARYDTTALCQDARRGTAQHLSAYCYWDFATGVCREQASYHRCSHTINDDLRSWTECNTTSSCAWNISTDLCESRLPPPTNTSLDDSCNTFPATNCSSCVFEGGDSLWCNPQCVYTPVEGHSCVPHRTLQCNAYGYAKCTHTRVCEWRGNPPTSSGRAASVQQTEDEETTDAKLYAQPDALHFTFGCFHTFYQQEKIAWDYISLCNSITSKEACANATSFEAGNVVCEWFEQIVKGSQPIPRAPSSSFEKASWGQATRPRAFEFEDVGSTFPAGAKFPNKERTATAPDTVSCESIAEGVSVNTNGNAFAVVWERPMPNFPIDRHYREASIGVGSTAFRSKVVRLWFAPVSEEESQIDAVAIVGRASRDHGTCGGRTWVSPVPVGTAASAANQQGSVWAVPCSGRGECSPHGCRCFGNFFGEVCEACKLGYAGPACEHRIKTGCTAVVSEDAAFLSGERDRWLFSDRKDESSLVVRSTSFGRVVKSPVYHLSGQSHVRVSLGVVMMDLPLNEGNCVIRIIIGRSQATIAADGEVVYARRCSLYALSNTDIHDVTPPFVIVAHTHTQTASAVLTSLAEKVRIKWTPYSSRYAFCSCAFPARAFLAAQLYFSTHITPSSPTAPLDALDAPCATRLMGADTRCPLCEETLPGRLRHRHRSLPLPRNRPSSLQHHSHHPKELTYG